MDALQLSLMVHLIFRVRYYKYIVHADLEEEPQYGYLKRVPGSVHLSYEPAYTRVHCMHFLGMYIQLLEG